MESAIRYINSIQSGPKRDYAKLPSSQRSLPSFHVWVQRPSDGEWVPEFDPLGAVIARLRSMQVEAIGEPSSWPLPSILEAIDLCVDAYNCCPHEQTETGLAFGHLTNQQPNQQRERKIRREGGTDLGHDGPH